MAHIKCKCGSSMSNVMCPSENVVYVILKQRIDSAIAYNPDITLMDFITNWDEKNETKKVFISDEYDFWYCTECKRVYQCEIHMGGKSLAVYKPFENDSVIGFDELEKMNELIVFSNTKEDAMTEKDPSIKLANFIKSLQNTRYFISDDSVQVYVYDCNSMKLSCVYKLEPSESHDE